ncbi:MAG: LamG domain-containing protein [Solirubrobacteraceae bacterium]|nr:LamG domain-containing protein [Patulibacter sp.]
MQRRNRSLLLALGALAIAPAGALAASPLIGDWPLDSSHEDGATQVTADTSGNALDLTVTNGAMHLGTPSLFGTGATLGTNRTPMTVTSPLLAPPQVTLLAWIKQAGNPGTLRYIAGRGDDGAPTCSGSTYALYSGYPGKGGLRFYTRNGPAGGSALTDAPADAAVFDGKWHLIAGTYDGSATRLFVDGAQIGAAMPAPAPLDYALGGGTSFYVDGYPVDACNLGADSDDWPGSIDEVRVYDRALTSTELTRLAAAQPGPTAPALVTDESLIPTPTPSPAPVLASIPIGNTVSGPPAPAPPAPGGKVADAQSLQAGAASAEGASKKAPSAGASQAAAASKLQALDELRQADGASQVTKPTPIPDLSAKEQKALKPDEAVQKRLDTFEYGLSTDIPAPPGTVVESVARLILEMRTGGIGKSRTVILPASTAIAEAAKNAAKGGGEASSAQMSYEVDKRAEKAMADPDIAKATVVVDAVTLDNLSDLSTLEQQRLQNAMATRDKAMAVLNTLLKKVDDLNQAMAANIRGGVTKSEQAEQKSLGAAKAQAEKKATKAEATRDAASVEAAQAVQSVAGPTVAGLIAQAAQPDPTKASLLSPGTSVLKGCSGKGCSLEAASN